MSWFRKSPPSPPTDLFGNPLSKGQPFVLNKWQKRQAALLYHWTSMAYLEGLLGLIDTLIKGADVTLELAKLQDRDALLTNDRWGVRDTSANWSTRVYPALEDFRKSTIEDIALRATDFYGRTGANQCAHMFGEHSSLWMSAEEEEQFSKQLDTICSYALKLDYVVSPNRTLDDYSFSEEWQENIALFPRLPKFKVHTDIEAESGKLPTKTGVYVPQDDPLGALQFGWTGNKDGRLAECVTFNALGQRMVQDIGREALWGDGTKIATFAVAARKRGEKIDVGAFEPNDDTVPRWAPVVLSGNSFTKRPCKWYFVELVEDEYDDETEEEASPQSEPQRLRCEAGQPCPQAGFWFTPAKTGSRRAFKQGETMPEVASGYGATIWQWDSSQV
ncbi:hypothetical protein [Chitinimonas sp. BJB300]|uniref:hypothetical protein n=1 Tax=Chitinimonas sp. BJB300 TaxID=1559339 RepID=UPI000C0E8A18|nr:hypothetical protein [Chitinimonas sp. BJB300]PHV11075.1 hypothetical protein CSQ89_12885 [Chitinimonas sp. BJB300]TSJ91518.1 hypothetical protein FG002_004400 [Chitinimonas sp. BJB300]